MDGNDLVGKVPLWFALAFVMAPGVWAVVVRWLDGRKANRKERADLVKIAQDAARGVIEDLQEHINSLHERIKALEEELMLARKEHSDTIASKDAELALLRGRLRQALSNIEAYERLLTAHEIPHPQPMQAFYLVEAGDYPSEVQPI